MLQAKYKAHRLINVIFYIIVFLIGFYMGLTSQKIGIKDLFYKFLLIDNVYADSSYDTKYTCGSNDECLSPPTTGSFDNGNGTWKDKDYIENMFNYFVDKYNLNISLGAYSYIVAYFNQNAANNKFVRYYFSRTPFDSLSTLNSSDAFEIDYSYLYNEWTIYYKRYLDDYWAIHIKTASSQSNLNPDYYINFSHYYYFNENLFSNNNDFKQVCVNPKKPFVISATSLYDNKNYFADFIWFPFNINYLKQGRYNSEYNRLIFDEPSSKNYYFFNSSDKFSRFDVNKGLLLPVNTGFYITSSYPYSNRFNYYGWSAYPFAFDSTLVSDSPDLPVFQFSENFSTVYMSSFNIAHGGGGRRLYDTEDPQNDNLQMCFYINKFYTVSELTEDSFGQYDGEIETPNGTINIHTTDSDDFFGSFPNNDFGLTSIITSPLVAINSIVDGTCTPQSVSILGKTITLPCGDTIFWGREDVQTFKIFWNMFAGGLICYGIAVSLYNLINDIRNPQKDRIDVIKL